MKHAKLKIALTAAAAVTFALGLVGCSGGSNKADYDHVVTFDYNVGTLLDIPGENQEQKDARAKTYTSQYLGVKDGEPVALKPGDKDYFNLAVVKDYEFNGWYLPESYGENGEPVRGEDDRVILGDKWDFKNPVTEDITLYASFVVKARLTVLGVVVGEDGNASNVKLENQKKLNDLLIAPVGSGFTRPEKIGAVYEPTSTGYTFVEYYKDRALTEVFDWDTYTIEKDDTVYAKFRAGIWAFNVTTAEQFNSAIRNNKNITLAGDIDYTGVTWTRNTSYSGIIEGNHHTVSNISCAWEGKQYDSNFALFSLVGATFQAKDVAFENVEISFAARFDRDFTVSAFANRIADGAVFENFTFSAKLTVSKGSASKAYIEKNPICPNAPSALEAYFTVTIIEE